MNMKIEFAKSVLQDVVAVTSREKEQNTFFEVSKGSKTLVIGIGERKDINQRKLILLFRRIIATAKPFHLKKIALNVSDFDFSNIKISDFEKGELMATNFEMANYEFVSYKTKPKQGWDFVEKIVLIGENAELKKGIKKGQTIGQEVNASRTLCNTPAGEMTPNILFKEAKKAAQGTDVLVKTLSLKEIRDLQMGGVLGVSQGSKEEPRFIILEYLPNKTEQPIVLIGKGVTFDTGGLNLKPGQALLDMHMDIS